MNERLIQINSKRFLEKPKLKILIFKGGGYSGCVWEWNALVFDHGKPEEEQQAISGYTGREFFDTFKSGNRTGMRNLLTADNSFLIRRWKDWLEFCKEYNSGFVRRVARIVDLEIPCEGCGHLTSPDEIWHDGYQGDGGIGISYSGLYCYDCIYTRHEDYCAEHEWPRLSTKEKRAALKKYREETGLPVRRGQIPYANLYAGEPEFY